MSLPACWYLAKALQRAFRLSQGSFDQSGIKLPGQWSQRRFRLSSSDRESRYPSSVTSPRLPCLNSQPISASLSLVINGIHDYLHIWRVHTANKFSDTSSPRTSIASLFLHPSSTSEQSTHRKVRTKKSLSHHCRFAPAGWLINATVRLGSHQFFVYEIEAASSSRNSTIFGIRLSSVHRNSRDPDEVFALLSL